MPRARVASASALAAGVLLGVGILLAAAPASAQTAIEPKDQIVLSGGVNVHRGEDVGEVVVLHGSAIVAGVAHGDVVVVDGPIEVTGQVSGSVVAMNGSVAVGPNAQILGDVMARDRVEIAESARIGGTVREGAAFTWRASVDVFGPFAAWFAIAISTLVLGALLLLLAPRGADAVAAAATGSPLASGGFGLLAFVGLPVLAALAIVSLVGLPFGLPLLLAIAFLYSVGFAWSVYAVGRAIWRARRSRWLALLFGWVIVAGLSAIPYVGGFLWFVGAVLGLGASVVASWRARRAGGRHRPGGKMQPEPVVDLTEEAVPEPMITERAMREEGTGI